MRDLIGVKQDEKTIIQKRVQVTKDFLKHSKNICSQRILTIDPADLRLLYRIYDEIFWQQRFQNFFSGQIDFSLSKRMTRSAGLTKIPRNSATIRPERICLQIVMGVDFFFRYEDGKCHNVCGIPAEGGLIALQLALEHELCHVIEYLIFGKTSCKGKRFKEMANNLFGHLESHHQMPTARQIAARDWNCRVGDQVRFQCKGNNFVGIITNIHKRATVMVKNATGNFVDGKGTRYSKYYVPLPVLKKAE